MKSYQKIHPNPSRTIIVGDIHGCFDEFKLLLEKVKFSPEDLLISVGDLVDRGPKSWEVVDYFYSTENAYSVLGNHERRLYRSVEGSSQPAWSQLHTLSHLPLKDGDNLLSYMASLPAVIETENSIITHARLDPKKPLQAQDPYFTCAVGGPSVQIETDKEGVPLWFTDLKEKNVCTKPVFIGHLGYSRIELVPHLLYALDTGAVRGNSLTAVIVETEEIVQHEVVQNHFQNSYDLWQEEQYAKIDPATIPFKKIKGIIKRESPRNMEIKTLHNFKELIEKMDIFAWLNRLREKVLRIYGEPPSNDEEKGVYFRKISADVPKPYVRTIRFLITGTPFSLEKLLQQFSKMKNLQNTEKHLDETENYLDKIN